MDDTIKQVRELLDKAMIRYISIIHSQAYSSDEMAVNDYNLGNELVDSVLIKIDNQQTVMIVVPATRKISLESLQKEFNNSNISFVGKREMAKLFPDYEAGTLPPLGQLYKIPVCCIDELTRMQELTFYLGTRAHRIRMKTKDFFKVSQIKKTISAVTTPRYRAEVYSINPVIKKYNLHHYKRCILGISLENKNFTTGKLVGMIDWICRHFSHCTVLIGDSIHRHTLEIQGVNQDYALNKALRLGRETIDTNNPVFQSYSQHCNIKVVLCSQIQDSSTYNAHYHSLQYLFLSDDIFSTSLRDFAETFVERRAELGDAYYRECIEKSCIYLLEELAIFACLSAEGHQVFVYPGALNILTEISEGLHPNAPQPLKSLVSVALKIKRCGAS